MSRPFAEAQYFCTHPDFELHVWARARHGRLVRGFGRLGQKSLTLWNEGVLTREERDLGFQFLQGRSPGLEPTPSAAAALPDAKSVLQLASLWSIDPTTLDGFFKEPGKGLLGRPPWAKT
ncbi:MAG: hypothetical protein JO112_01525 [Planctomycetes bacterium]|nr:hypothetical protein [Planctomycetota bacterium]